MELVGTRRALGWTPEDATLPGKDRKEVKKSFCWARRDFIF